MRYYILALITSLLFAACQANKAKLPSEVDIPQRFTVEMEEAEVLASSILPGRTFELLNSSDAHPAYYIFNAHEGGFVIVSAHEAAEPILGYSDKESISLSNLPLGLIGLLDEYSQDINKAREMGLTPSKHQLEMRSAILRASTPPTIIVDPLLGLIQWNQGSGYNKFTPDFTPVGCVATATAMIMRYWEYPERGQGVYQYHSDRFGTQGHDFNYTLQWGKMPKNKEALSALSDKEQVEATFHLSRFNYGVAVALNMNFDYGENGGSGTFQRYVPEMLQDFYKYPSTIRNLLSEDYSPEEWESMLRAELDAKRPVQYAGRGDGGGHSFVIDGYNDNGEYSLNWGWGGTSNGWFKLSALSPKELGTGGGSGGFDRDHEMVVGFEPPAHIKVESQGNSDILNPPLYDKPTVFPSMDLFIKYTRFNNIETYSTAGGYENYSDKVIESVDGKLDLTVMPQILRADASGYILLSLDLNHNGNFYQKDENDLIIKFDPIVAGNGISKSINLMSFNIKPEKGKKYTMRLSISPYGYANPNYMISGEIEDYTILIK